MAQTQVRQIRVLIDTKGNSELKAIQKGFADLNKSVQQTGSAVSSFRNAFVALQGLNFAGIGVRELTQASDSYQKLSDRVRVFTGDQESANTAMEGLARVADSTRASIDGVATVYTRLALSLNETGLKSDSLLFITEQLQNSFRLSGSTASEATGATIQLSQGLASGALRGQELRSVLEGNAIIGGLLADQLNTTRGNLMKLAEAGKITSDVFLNALAKGSNKINADVGKLGVTFQEATDRGINQFTIALGKLNQQIGASAAFDTFVQSLTKNVGLLSAALLGLAVSAIPTLITQIGRFAAILAVPLAPISAIAAGLGGVATVASFAFLEFDKFSQLGLKLRQGFVYAFALVSETFYKIVDAIAVTTEAIDFFNKGDSPLKKFAQRGIADAQGLKDGVVQTIKEIDEAYAQIQKGDAAAENAGVLSFEQQLDRFQKALEKMKSVGGAAGGTVQEQLRELNSKFADGAIDVLNYNKQVEVLTREIYKKKGPIPLQAALDKLAKESLSRLFENGILQADEFQDRLNSLELSQLQANFDKGRISARDFYDQMDKIRNRVYEVNQALRDRALIQYNKDFASGTLTVQEYRQNIEGLNLAKLNDEFKSGAIDVTEYNKRLTETSTMFMPGSALYTGIQNYISSAGTLSQNIATGITNTFGTLETYFTDFLKTGKANFADFTTAVLDDLQKIIVRSLIIRPLAQGILDFASGGASAATGAGTSAVNYNGAQNPYLSAKGSAYNNGVQYFAKGGIVDSPTGFSFGNKRLGVMGEAGTEAILPLSRSSNGDLGVNAAGMGTTVIINVVNQSNTEVQQSESTDASGNKVIDILIQNKIKETFMNGSMDRIMSTNYAVSRRSN